MTFVFKAVCLLGFSDCLQWFLHDKNLNLNIDMDAHDIFLIEQYYRYRRKESISTIFRRNLFWNGFFFKTYIISHILMDDDIVITVCHMMTFF